jgi:hypothetical protein
VAGSCEHGKGLRVLQKSGKFLHQMNDYQLLDCGMWSYLGKKFMNVFTEGNHLHYNMLV